MWARCGFNTQPPEGGCKVTATPDKCDAVSTHSRPKAAAAAETYIASRDAVSTHSRPKAAAFVAHVEIAARLFQHTAARRRLRFLTVNGVPARLEVSTHSRPKAAAPCLKTLLKSDN